MKWGLQHVQVTLEDAETGDIVVIEQRSDGTVICKEAGSTSTKRETKEASEAARSRRSAPEAKTKTAKKEEPPRAKAVKPKESKTKEVEPKEPKEPKKTRSKNERPKPTAKSTKKVLSWKAVKDATYDGFAAKVRHGVFKALHARNTQWALFFERQDSYPASLGCFRKLEQAKARAQELSDAGWPQIEFGEVTSELVERACPLPASEREERPVTKKTERKAEEKPAASEKPAPTPAVGGMDDAALMRSFKDAAATLLAEDDDED